MNWRAKSELNPENRNNKNKANRNCHTRSRKNRTRKRSQNHKLNKNKKKRRKNVTMKSNFRLRTSITNIQTNSSRKLKKNKNKKRSWKFFKNVRKLRVKLERGDFCYLWWELNQRNQPLVFLSRNVPFGPDWEKERRERERERKWAVWNLLVVILLCVLLEDGSDGWDGICAFNR